MKTLLPGVDLDGNRQSEEKGDVDGDGGSLSPGQKQLGQDPDASGDHTNDLKRN